MHLFEFNQATFQYLLCESIDTRFSNYMVLDNLYILNYTDKTDVIYSERDGKRITIIGLCVDSYSEISRKSIPKYLVEKVNNLNDLINIIQRFAGKYVIVYQNNDETYLFGDASSSLPVYWHRSYKCFSSSEHIIATYSNLRLSLSSKHIEANAHEGIGLPYNLTRYEDLFFLLPNHRIDAKAKITERYIIPPSNFKNEDYDSIVNRSIFLISNIVKEYRKYYKLVCPLTSGTDSRVNLSFLASDSEIECYTFDHSYFTENSPEINIPDNICYDLGIKYTKLKVKETPLSLMSKVNSLIGYNQLQSRIDLAYTIKKEFESKAIINGDIIDQVGKSGTFGEVSHRLSYDSYFITKTHSFSVESKKETIKYLSELRESISKERLYDYFALEIRCGRWGAQSSELYSSLGVNMLNIFNNTELIRLWMNVDRDRRANKDLHTCFLKYLNPQLLNYPFNPNDKVNFIKNNKYFYFYASYLKYFYQSYRFSSSK